MTNRTIRFSDRVGRIQPSPTLLVLNRASELIAQGVDVIDFGPGEPDFITPEPIREAAKRAIDAGYTKYTNSLGSPEIRRAVAETYNRRYHVEIKPENVIAGSGGKQELFNLMLALVGDGDEVVIPAPYWVSFPDQVRLAGGTPVFAELTAAERFRPTVAAIEKVLTPKSCGVILNSPSNPTGAAIEERELEKIVELCRSRGLFLVYDETYELFLYDDQRHVSAVKWFHDFPETVIIVNSMSKTYAMTGWRLGFAVAHPQIISALGKIQSHSTSNPASISQAAAVEALRSGDAEVKKMYDAYVERRKWLVPALNEIDGVDCAWPDGAFYVFPRVADLYGHKGIDDSTSLARYLLDEARVAVVPGAAFGNDEHIRISYATSLENLREGVRRIREAVATLR
ncbi:MAG: pyridoxal phosphate-dependent aminotransferase [Thermoanaerobaculia bacterium]